MTESSFISPPDFRRAHVQLTQVDGPTAELGLAGDLLILVSSWERRCVEIMATRQDRYACASVIRFAEQGESGLRAVHDTALLNFAANSADHIAPLPVLLSSDVAGWRDALCDLLVKVAGELGRPLSVTIDLTCLPKYYALTLLGFAMRAGIVRQLTFFYAGGRYALPSPDNSLAQPHGFTEGEWHSFPVPYLEGELHPDRKVRIIAAIGFETFQARNFIGAYEAEQHELIMPYPGFSRDYEPRGEAETQALATYLDVPMESVSRIPAGSATGTAEAALGIIDVMERYNDLALCLGTKPQALGVGIAGLVRPQLTVVCRIPTRYTETETPASGHAWAYTITDFSVPYHRLENEVGTSGVHEQAI